MSLKGKEPYGCISGVNYGAKLAPPAKKIEAQGECCGYDWDDGVNDNVRKITVTYYALGVNSIKFEYAFGTQTVVGDQHGCNDKTYEKGEFMLEDNEYITSVEGHYGTKLPPPGLVRDTMVTFGKRMTMLKFNTNIATYEVSGTMDNPCYGYEYVGAPFKLEEKGHKIVGFYGKASPYSLNQIGAYVKPIDNA